MAIQLQVISMIIAMISYSYTVNNIASIDK